MRFGNHSQFGPTANLGGEKSTCEHRVVCSRANARRTSSIYAIVWAHPLKRHIPLLRQLLWHAAPPGDSLTDDRVREVLGAEAGSACLVPSQTRWSSLCYHS